MSGSRFGSQVIYGCTQSGQPPELTKLTWRKGGFSDAITVVRAGPTSSRNAPRLSLLPANASKPAGAGRWSDAVVVTVCRLGAHFCAQCVTEAGLWTRCTVLATAIGLYAGEYGHIDIGPCNPRLECRKTARLAQDFAEKLETSARNTVLPFLRNVRGGHIRKKVTISLDVVGL